jgi:frataxin-like iron-binding protein CyaY
MNQVLLMENYILEDMKTKLEIWVTNDKCFRLDFNQFGELVVNKQTYNEESRTIVIKPNVSNQINIL